MNEKTRKWNTVENKTSLVKRIIDSKINFKIGNKRFTFSLSNITNSAPNNITLLKKFINTISPQPIILSSVSGDETKPILLVYGAKSQQRKILMNHFKEHQMVFIPKKFSTKSINVFLEEEQVSAIVVSESSDSQHLRSLAKKHQIPIWEIENRISTVSLTELVDEPFVFGIQKEVPQSNLCSLEQLIESINLIEDPVLLVRAQNCIDLLTQLNHQQLAAQEDDYAILVIGQDQRTDLELIKLARNEFPHAKIIYKPCSNSAALAETKELCTVDLTSSYEELLQKVQHIYTVDSPIGMEGLIRGIKVTTTGFPYYAGWGDVDCRSQNKKRAKRKTVLDIFAAAYLQHPTYSMSKIRFDAQFEHLIFVNFLMKQGIQHRTAEFIAIEYDITEITLPKCLAIKDLLQNSSLYQNLLEKHKTAKEVFALSYYLKHNSLTNCLLDIIKTNPQNKSAYYSLLEVYKFERSIDDLTYLKNIPPDAVPNACIKPYVKLLSLIYEVDYAESFIFHKLQQEENLYFNNLLLLLRNLLFIYGEQARLGRKPNDQYAAFLENVILSRVPRRYARDKSKRLVVTAFSCLLHNRLYVAMNSLVNQLRVIFDIDEKLGLYLDTNLLCIQALVADSKRQVISSHHRFETAKKIFIELEALFYEKWACSVEQYPQITLLYLSQMANTVLNDQKFILYSAQATQTILQRHNSLMNYNGEIDTDSERPPAIFSSPQERQAFLQLVGIKIKHFIKIKNPSEAIEYLERIKDIIPEELFFNSLINISTNLGNHKKTESLLLFLVNKYQRIGYYKRLATNLRLQGELRKALTLLLSIKEKFTLAYTELEALNKDIEVASFLLESSEILAQAPQPKHPRGVIFVSACMNSVAILVPVLLELKRRNYAIIQVEEGLLQHEPTGLEWLDQHAGVIPSVSSTLPSLDINALENSWDIAWHDRKLISGGINFYQGLFEILTQRLRAFNFNIDDPEVYRWFLFYLIRCDKALSLCNSIKNSVLNKGIPVRFINCGSHAAPFSVYRSFCLKHSESYDLAFIHMGPAYENYYTNLKNRHATTVCLENLTNFPNYRLPFLARPDLFEQWLSNNNYSNHKEKIDFLLNMDRVAKKVLQTTGTHSVEDRLIEAARDGKKIIGIYGKILCDMAVPYDGGPAHTDIVDWFKHTVSLASKTDNLLVLKPHPHEMRPEIAKDLNEYWLDVIDVHNLPDNIVVLPHNGFNNQDLIKYLDLAVLWNGTSSLELTAQGVPVMMASYFGKHDYPVDLIYPESRQHYEHLILKGVWEKPSKELMTRAALLLIYMGTEEICIPFNFSFRPITNEPIGVPYWHKKEIERLITFGDSNIKRMADKVFG